MNLNLFRYEFNHRGGVFITEDVLLLRKPLELYSLKTGETISCFQNLDDALSTEISGQQVRQIVESWEHIPVPVIRGGRGGSSGMDYEQKWPSAGGGNGKDNTTPDLPARMNVKMGVNRTYADALKAFIQTHADADMEHGATFDAQGFTTRYVHGNQGSVAISGSKGEMVVHNHPFDGWPNFSKEDLLSAALGRESGIVAVSSTKGRRPETAKYAGTYSFVKGTHFDSSGFVKAVRNASIKGKDYNDAVSRWLKANQKKYGYTFTYKK